MAVRQVLSPNLDTDPNNPLYIWIGGQILTDWLGWCLAVVAGSYGAAGSSYSAKTAWQSCPTKHYDRNIPEYVWVPLWYEGGDYGHVVMGFRQGNGITIYSSPYTHKATFDRFDGELNWALDYIGRVYGVGSFTGWSETVLDSRVIEFYDDTPAPQEPAETNKGDDMKEDTTKPEEPTQNGSEEPTTNNDSPEPNNSNSNAGSDSNSQSDDKTNNDETTGGKGEFVPAKSQDAQLINGLIEEAGEDFEPSKTVKLIAYLVGDALLVGSLLIPDIVNTIQAPNGTIWAEYMSKVLLEAGIAVLTVFKLLKRKGK